METAFFPLKSSVISLGHSIARESQEIKQYDYDNIKEIQMAMTQLTISLLGPFQVTRDDEVVTQFGSDTARALLAYLVMHPGRAHRRDALAGLLWPERPNTEALRNLRVALSRLRDAIGDRQADISFLEVTHLTIQLTDNASYKLDAREMRECLSATKMHDHIQIQTCEVCSKQLQMVADLYRGEFLSGFALDSAPFEEWMVVERENLHWQVLEALYTLTTYYDTQGNYEAAITCARRQVELESWREGAHRQWMRALALSGHRGAALAQFDTCRKVLAEEIGVEPEAETVTLYEQIRAGKLVPPTVTTTEQAAVPIQTESTSSLIIKGTPAEVPGPELPSIIPGIPDGERSTVTVVQADVSGMAALLAGTDTEDWVTMINQLLQTARAEIHRYGGEVNRYDESGMVAIFGAKEVHEDDAERGVLAALAMQQAFQAEISQMRDEKPDIDDIDVRIGVHTGDVIVTIGEGQGGIDRTVIGEAIIFTKRLLVGIAPGELRVSEATYRLVASLFEWESQDGGEDYVPLAHYLGGDKGRGFPGMQSVLVGREQEFHVMNEAVEQLQSGIGGIVTLVGEAGIGKSRLMAEVRKSTNVKWVEGRCLSYSGTMAYSLWQGILHDLLGTTPDTPPAIFNHILRKHMRKLSAERYKLNYAYLGRLLSIPLDAESEALVIQLDAENLKNGTFTTVESLFQNIAQRQPMVIVCEDLHWADPTSLALLEHLLSLADRVPLLFICVFRPQWERSSWRLKEKITRSYPHRLEDVQLESLSINDGEKLLENLLVSLPGPGGRKPVEGLPDELKAQILKRSEGNPFYVEEILRTLIRSGSIVCQEISCRWEANQQMKDIGIPDTLYGVLRSRIDQLPAGARHILHLASVIGRFFSYPLLADIADRSMLDEHLVTLQREQMIRERVRLPEAEYIFKHQLTLEAAYGSLLHRVRRVLHQRVAEALERLYPERIEMQLGLLAHHWEQAGEIEKAVDYLRRAGRQAANLYANDEAVNYFSRVLDLIPSDDLTRRYAILSLRESVYDRTGMIEEQLADLLQLQGIADVLNDGGKKSIRRLAEVTLREANYYEHTFNQGARTNAAQKAVHLAEKVGNASLQAEGHLRLGSAFSDSWDKEAARMHWEKALTLARAGGHRYLEAQVLRELGISMNEMGRFREARIYLEQNLQIYCEIGNLMEEGKALNALAMIHMMLHDLSQAKTYIADGLRLCHLTGNRREEAWALWTLGAILSLLGNYSEGDERQQEAVHLFRQVNDPVGECRVIQTRAWYAQRMGDDEANWNLSKQALSLAKEINALPVRAIALVSLGDAHASQLHWSDAYDAYQESLSLCNDQGWHHWGVSALSGLARVALSRNALEEAQTHVQEILNFIEKWPSLEGTWDPMRVYLTCYRVLLAASDPRAGYILCTAHQLLEEWADNIEDEALRRSFLENVLTHREIMKEFLQNQ